MIPNSTLLCLRALTREGRAATPRLVWFRSGNRVLVYRRPQVRVEGQFDCGRVTGLNGRAGGSYLENEPRFVSAIDPRRIRLVAGLRQGFDAPDNPSRTQRPTDPTRVYTGIVGRTSANERWQAEDCGRQMTDKHRKRPRDLKGPLRRLRYNTAQLACATSPRSTSPQSRRGSTPWKASSPSSRRRLKRGVFRSLLVDL
jgi:hypothetical protein